MSKLILGVGKKAVLLCEVSQPTLNDHLDTFGDRVEQAYWSLRPRLGLWEQRSFDSFSKIREIFLPENVRNYRCFNIWVFRHHGLHRPWFDSVRPWRLAQF